MPSSAPMLVLHGHFYQPPRENPWTETVPVEPSAAPAHDWNERITAECYRPNGWARVVDESGRLVALVNNYAHLSFDVGPTLCAWLAEHRPDVLARMVEGDRAGGGAIAQAYSHLILPLATERDVRTQVRWGLADFRARFGRPAEGMWLPEAAVDDAVLAVLADEGVRFTILAPTQVAAVRPLGEPDAEWQAVDAASLDTLVAYRWCHPDGSGRSVDLLVYDGAISHDLAFGLGGLSSQALVDRVVAAAPDGGVVAVATDGETFGHHHHFAERGVAYAVAVEAPRRRLDVVGAAAALAAAPPVAEAKVKRSAWSCAHGVGRWAEDCGCSTGGQPGWDQRWRAPLRAALDLLRDAAAEVFERRGSAVLADPWAARDAYGEVVCGGVDVEAFAADQVTGDRVEALTLLESQRHAMAMYTSCGWFFNDLAGLETVQVLRHAARVMDHLRELGEAPPEAAFLDVLATARSNVEAEGDGRSVWERHVLPARVDAGRVAAHVALAELLGRGVPAVAGGHEVEVEVRVRRSRGSLTVVAGRAWLQHRRTRRCTVHAFAAAHLGGFEVVGATRPADERRDGTALDALDKAVRSGQRLTTLLRRLVDDFGPDEFGLEAALPDEGGHIVAAAADELADRFVEAYDRLVADHQPALNALAVAGYPLPAVLRAPAGEAAARRLEAALDAIGDPPDRRRVAVAAAIARDAQDSGLAVTTPAVIATLNRVALAAVERAAAEPTREAVKVAMALLRLAGDLRLQGHPAVNPAVEAAQERLYEALRDGGSPSLRPLAEVLNLAVDRLGTIG
jgi:alpha-amylase/alpha-mannosidase (GH57 family)